MVAVLILKGRTDKQVAKHYTLTDRGVSEEQVQAVRGECAQGPFASPAADTELHTPVCADMCRHVTQAACPLPVKLGRELERSDSKHGSAAALALAHEHTAQQDASESGRRAAGPGLQLTSERPYSVLRAAQREQCKRSVLEPGPRGAPCPCPRYRPASGVDVMCVRRWWPSYQGALLTYAARYG